MYKSVRTIDILYKCVERWNKGGTFISRRSGSLQRKPRLDHGICSGMPERDGKDQEED